MRLIEWIKSIFIRPNYDEKYKSVSHRIYVLSRFRNISQKNATPNSVELPWYKINNTNHRNNLPLLFKPFELKINTSMAILQRNREIQHKKHLEEVKSKIKESFAQFDSTFLSKNVKSLNKTIVSLTPLIAELNDAELKKQYESRRQKLVDLKEEIRLQKLEQRRIEEERRKELEEKKREEERIRKEEEERKRLERERIAREYERKRIEEENRIIEAKTKLKESVTRQSSEKHEILEYLRRNNVTCFYHFTDERNIPSIRKNGGLFSWYYCENNNLHIPNPGGSDQSRDLDLRHSLEDYVRLSFCNDHPMSFRKHKEGSRLVLLKIEIDVATFLETQFSDINAADSDAIHGKGLEYLKRVDISATKRNFVSRTDADFAAHQAECMVKTFIPIDYITNINNPEPMKFSS